MFKKTWEFLKAVGNVFVEHGGSSDVEYTDSRSPTLPIQNCQSCCYVDCCKEGVVPHEGGSRFWAEHSAIITQQVERRARIAKWFRSWLSWQGHLGEGEGRGGQ
jgi:hypothetical protein